MRCWLVCCCRVLCGTSKTQAKFSPCAYCVYYLPIKDYRFLIHYSMKHFFLVLIISLCASSVFAQTFKITGFVSDDKKFDSIEARLMGKQLTLIVYDNSASIKIGNDSPDLMHLIRENEYNLDLSKSNTKETQTLNLKLNKTLAFITSVELTFLVRENEGYYRHSSWTLTAKRF